MASWSKTKSGRLKQQSKTPATRSTHYENATTRPSHIRAVSVCRFFYKQVWEIHHRQTPFLRVWKRELKRKKESCFSWYAFTAAQNTNTVTAYALNANHWHGTPAKDSNAASLANRKRLANDAPFIATNKSERKKSKRLCDMPGHEWYGDIRSQPCGILCTKTTNGRKRILYKNTRHFSRPVQYHHQQNENSHPFHL